MTTGPKKLTEQTRSNKCDMHPTSGAQEGLEELDGNTLTKQI